MPDVGDLTYGLLKRVHADLGEIKRDLESKGARFSSLEQPHATMAEDLAQIRRELDFIRSDISHIRRRMDLVEA